MARHTKLKNFIFCLTFCTPYSDNIFDIMSSCQYFLQMRTRTASQFSSFITQKITNFFEMYAGPIHLTKFPNHTFEAFIMNAIPDLFISRA